MTLEQLRIFVAVADRQHLTQAAEALHLSPSAVSSAIKVLEERYAAVLFHRVGRRIELTETGRLFLPEARNALAAAAAAEMSLSEAAGLQRGALRIEASQTIAGYWVPTLLVRFHTSHPGIDLALGIGNTQTVARAVLEGAADIGFIEGEIDEPALAQRVVAEDRLIVVTAPDHPWAGRGALSGAVIAAGHWLLREPGSGTRSAFLAALTAKGIDPAALDVVMTLPSNEAVRTAVAAGPLAGVMSERVAGAAIAAGRLVRIDFELPMRAFRMLWHKERYRTHAARALEELAVATVEH
ncbi:MAG: LysR family transcriptional regulator [Devosia sp.]|nr:LysR family transcriptional regulator [Devosia sp.]